MALTDFTVGTPLQGYPDDGKALAADVAVLLEEFRLFTVGAARKDDKAANDVEKLMIGSACSMIYDAVEARLATLRTKLSALRPNGVDDGLVKLHMGPLKKLDRIAEKAVQYAVCTKTQSASPRLDRVCDILRATIEFPAAYFGKPKIGGAMIDAVNTEFKGAVVQVKNRFIEKKWPSFADYSDNWATDALRKQIIEYVDKGLKGREGFYRDMNLLVKLGGEDWSTGSELSHVMLEVQLVPTQMYAAKSGKGADGTSGHDMYKVFRCVVEHCEYAVFTNGGKDKPKFENAWQFFPDPKASAWMTFTERAQDMWSLYHAAMMDFKANLATAIDESAWYTAAKK